MTGRYQLEPVADGVASIRIASDADPNVTVADLDALRGVVEALQEPGDVRALLIEGGERTFCGGATREALLDDEAASAIHHLVGTAARLILSIPVPTVAAMRGHAVGGGLMFGLWCDAAVLASESLYSANFVALGFTPGMGSTVLLPEVVGPVLARELLLTGRTLKGSELAALAPGFRHAVVPRSEVRERALALAEAFAEPSPRAVRLTKRHLSAGRRAALDQALDAERAMHEQSFDDPATRRQIAEHYIGGDP